MADLADELNLRIKTSARSGVYTVVKVLILYWSEGHPGFKEEGRLLGSTFKKYLQYEVQDFPIPSAQSYLRLHSCISQIVLQMGETSEIKDQNPLLIIHYGGHGDQNDDHSQGEEKRSVWAAQSSDGPTLDWFRIQEDLKNTNVDTLLLLDCCFAAQAGRGRDQGQSRLEVLAAAAMGVRTPMPGPRSFTKALTNELAKAVQETGYVVTTDLHRRLVAREANLHATPVYISLLQRTKPITLTPLSTTLVLKKAPSLEGTYYQIVFHAEDVSAQDHLHEIAFWLGDDRPRGVTAIAVQNVLQVTTQIRQAFEAIDQDDSYLAANIDKGDLATIASAWQHIKHTIETYNGKTTHRGSTIAQPGSNEESLEVLLADLQQENNTFTNALKRGLFNSANISTLASVQRTLESPLAGIDAVHDQLQKRRMICTDPELGAVQSQSAADNNQEMGVLGESKYYGQYASPLEVLEMAERVALLAALLRGQESRDFLSLRCYGWTHDRIDHCFRFRFEIPDAFARRDEDSQNLSATISKTTGSSRPSLDQRLRIAYQLAKAVESWHAVGWVHQGINSYSVKFLRSKISQCFDYDYPILHGFEFARPKSDPSLGRPADDVLMNIYRHPNRQGISRKSYTKIHDIYSLGVVLLEIGVWQTAAGILKLRPNTTKSMPGEEVQKQFVTACNERLTHYAGGNYSKAVIVCLKSCFDVPTDDGNETHLARAFQRDVVDQLSLGLTPLRSL